MGDGSMILILFAILLFIIFCGTPVFTSMGFTAILCVLLWVGVARLKQFGVIVYTYGTSFNQIIAPMFICMSEFLSQGRVAEDIYSVLNRSIGKIRGGLAVSTVVATTVFATLCGSSPATAAAMGKITISEMVKRGYSPSFAAGTVAAGGTLGIMFPPSITLCLYGIITETSIVRLFMAGIVPGVMLSAMMALYVIIVTRLRPSITNWTPKEGDQTYEQIVGAVNLSSAKEIVGTAAKLAEAEAGARTETRTEVETETSPDVETETKKERKSGFLTIAPAIILIIFVLGSMYTGLATPLEAAGYGVVGSMILIIVQRRLTLKIFGEIMRNTARTGTMMVFLITAGMCMTFVVSYLGIGQAISELVTSSGMSKYQVLMILYLIWLIIGTLMDPASMMLLSIPFLFQTLVDFGFDPVWIGIMSVFASEIAMITPPTGMNLFVLKANCKVPMGALIKGSLPYVVLLLIGGFLMTLFPEVVLFLPSRL